MTQPIYLLAHLNLIVQVALTKEESCSFSRATVEFSRYRGPQEKILLLGRSGPGEGRLGQPASGTLHLALET